MTVYAGSMSLIAIPCEHETLCGLYARIGDAVAEELRNRHPRAWVT